MKPHTWWDATKDALLGEMFAAGQSDVQIGDAFNTSRGAISHRRRTLGFRRNPAVWSPELVQAASKMWGEGYSAQQISTTLRAGLSRSAIYQTMKRLGVMGGTRTAEPKPRLSGAQRRAASGIKKPPLKAPKAPRMVSTASQVARPTLSSLLTAFQPLPGDTHRPLVEHRLGQCRWPLEIDGKHFACCRPAVAQRYCTTHEAIALRPSQVKPVKPWVPARSWRAA